MMEDYAAAAPVMLPDLAAMDRAGRALAGVLKPGDVIALEGDLGAGKTTLARAILNGLGLVGDAPSPSFAIVQPYAPPEVAFPVLHIDLYRLEYAAEVAELGLDEARSDHAVLIEWPDRMGSTLWDDTLRLALDIGPDSARRLTARLPKAWEGRWPL